MKLNKLFMGFLGALALTACSSEDVVVPDNGGTVGEGEPRYMSVTIRNANPGTRAGDPQNPEQGEVFGDYETGYTLENEVTSLRFYFFDAVGNAIAIDGTGHNYYTCADPGKTGANMPNVEKILDAVIVLNTNNSPNRLEDIKQMVAVVNYDNVPEIAGGANLGLGELASIVNRESAATTSKEGKTTGFLMTSSSFYNSGFAQNKGFAVEITAANIKDNPDDAKRNPVDVYVERQVAKVRVKAAWDKDKMKKIKDNVTLKLTNGSILNNQTAVQLYDKPGADGQPIYTSNLDSEKKEVYVIFTEWDLWWTASHSYLFKKVDNWTNPFNAWNWNHENYYRSYWAENPGIRNSDVTVNANKEKFTLSKHAHNYPSRKIIYNENAYKEAYADYTAYCLENAGDPNNDGKKLGYNPDAETSNRTLVYLSAILVTVDENDVATPLSLVEWGGVKFTESAVLTKMFAERQNIYYVRNVVESSSVTETDEFTVIEGEYAYKYLPVVIDDVKFVTGIEAGKAGSEIETDKRYLSYMNLVDAKTLYGLSKDDDEWGTRTFKGVTYNNIEKNVYKYNDVTKKYELSSIDDANTDFELLGGAKVWRDGNTYYYHELAHLGQTGETEKDVYGVVRNHIYEVTLNTVYGLGTPVLSPKDDDDSDFWEEIIPQKPTPDAFFIGARMNILSWRIVNTNTADLIW